MSGDRLSAEERAAHLVERAFGVKDRRMRTVILGEVLRELSTEEVVSVLDVILDRVDRRRPKYQEIYLSIVDREFLAGVLGAEKVDEVVTRARESGCERVLHLFSCPDPGHEVGVTGDSEVPAGLEYLTLGEKKSLARGERTLIWEKLLLDLDPAVIRNILSNPRITEQEVVKIASRRPCPGSILREIFLSQRWVQRYRVKRTLVFNPCTPVDVGRNLLSSLMVADLEEVSRDGGIDSSIREWAKDLLKKRRTKGKREKAGRG